MGRLKDAPSRGPDRLDRPSADPLLRRVLPELAIGTEWTLGRTERALASLGDPHASFRSFHVGGTNGKGSVTATIASVLTASGYRTGAYTSPHLCSFRERMLVDGAPIAEETLVRYGADVRDAILRFGLTFFEAVTVLAFHAFREEGVDVASVEVGLGGRLDATNVLVPEVCGVTNIAMDHAEYLGSTLPEIAREKAGIMKRGVPFVTTERDPDLLALFDALAKERGAPWVPVPPDAARDAVVTREGTRFRLPTGPWGELEVTSPLVGAHQVTNTTLAITMLAHAPADLRPPREALLAGVRSVRHRGRDEVRVIDGLTWILDVAHNEAGVASLADTLDRIGFPRPLVALVGVLGDKDWRAMLPPLVARAEAVVLTVPSTAPSDRRWDPVEAARALASTPVPNAGTDAWGSPAAEIHAEADFARALERVTERAGGGTVVVTGSVHTVGNAMALLGIDPLA